MSHRTPNDRNPGWAASLSHFTIKELTAETFGDFAALVERNGGSSQVRVHDVPSRLRGEGPGRERNRALKHRLVADGIAHFVPPWASFDEDGNKVSPEDEAAQDSEWKAQADEYRAQMIGLTLSTDDAARLCVDWARHNYLTHGSLDDVAIALTSNHTFVEETFTAVLESLGGCTR